MNLPVTGNVTYTAKWTEAMAVVSFHMLDHEQDVYPIEPIRIPHGNTAPALPIPVWLDNGKILPFDGWYLNEELTVPLTQSHVFLTDTILYAKWSQKDDGYFIYFMDFVRNNDDPLVLMTYSVTAEKTASPYTPANAPDGTQWDGVWYLDSGCTSPYDFAIPVSQMDTYLTGANKRDLYLYPGTQNVCRSIFVTYGTKLDPVTIPVGEAIDLSQYVPRRDGYIFDGWVLEDQTAVSGMYTLQENTTFYATWKPGYVPFEAVLRAENANDTAMSQVDMLGTWYALAGSQIRVNSVYSGSGNNRTGTHSVVCVLDGVEYPVYTDQDLTQKATLADVYSTYFVYNNTGTDWEDEVNWDDVYTGGEVPYSTRPVSSSGETIIHFDYMRVRKDIVFTIPNVNSNNNRGGYIDVYKLYQNGLITGAVTYNGTTPTQEGSNVSAEGISAQNIRWSYQAASRVGSGNYNYYTLHDMKYGQRIFEVYPVGATWLTPWNAYYGFHQYSVGSNQNFASRRQDLSADFFSGSGRKLTPYSLTAEFESQQRIALMYAIECLNGETADFTINGTGYKVQTQLCEVVYHTGGFSIKDLVGCEPGTNPLGSGNNNYYSNLNSSTKTIGSTNTSVKTLFGTTYWPYYNLYVSNLSEIDRAYIFYYDRIPMNVQFNFAYDSNEDGSNEVVEYEGIAYGESITEYQFGMPNRQKHTLLEREGYEFAGWLDSNGNILTEKDWASMVTTGDSEHGSMIFIAKWEKISNNIVEYYEDVSAEKPFETHYFEDGARLEYPNMTVYPEGWVWKEPDKDSFTRFDWDVPMYGEDGVREIRQINGEEVAVNVIRIYGTWNESQTKVAYDPNAAQGGIPGTAPTDTNEYTIWQSEVPVMSAGSMTNMDSDMRFVGWLLDRDGIVYQPGDHVPVRWPRTMIFTAQWAKPEEIVALRYDPNGGLPQSYYPNEYGFTYKRNSTAAVWDNASTDGTAHFSRTGYSFTGWNTEPDGSGTAYSPGNAITLEEQQTTLYAQWEKQPQTLTLHKVDSESDTPLRGAVFSLYRYENEMFLLQETLTTGENGQITFMNLGVDTLYKLVEEKPPDGYAIIAREICFRLEAGESTVSFVYCDSAGNVTSAPGGVTGEYYTGSRLLDLKVRNLRGYELPATGGTGIYLYILCGLALMAAPFVYGFSLWRRRERGGNS